MVSLVLDRVAKMSNNKEACTLANEFGLCINNVSWEDCARTKNSAFGPCISDMTLQVKKTPLPIIRLPNYSDVTWDQPMKNIPLNVGNEFEGRKLKQVSLFDYLNNINPYLSKKNLLQDKSFIAPERDSHVIMSSQACFLPIEEGSDTKFNVNIFNYQTLPNDPAILAIVATSSGTSAQIVNSKNQNLFFNQHGQRASFIAQRLKDQRKQQGKMDLDAEMSAEEKADNMILIIQVPLLQKPRTRPSSALRGGRGCGRGRGAMKRCRAAIPAAEVCDVDQAIISVGEPEGPFTEIPDMSVKRDTRYPVRVTLQYYKATSNGIVTSDVIQEIAVQMITARSFASCNEIGSLVTSTNDGNSSRPTESTPVMGASWWREFWQIHHPIFPDFSENQAKKTVFSHPIASSLQKQSFKQVEQKVISILQGNFAQQNPKPLWDPSSPMKLD